MSKQVWANVLLMCLAFALAGSLPRAIGILSVRPGAEWVYIVDAVVIVVGIVASFFAAATANEKD